MKIVLPSSKLQTSIASSLETFRRLYLQQALSETIRKSDLRAVNAELDSLVPEPDLRDLASRGIRGEFVFAVPSVLRTSPFLLGYYRLLFGFSQKEFYQKSKLGRFETMESRGIVPERVQSEVEALCAAFCRAGSELIREIGPDRLTLDLLDDLALLTLGPQLRGGHNTKIGQMASTAVLELIESIVRHAIQEKSVSQIVLLNSSGRKVTIGFSSDPDISVREEISRTTIKNMVAIEIKGGGDKSNIWNRLGEAEKSHQTAKIRGFVEFWTIYNVVDLDPSKAHEKSPTTTRFYSLPMLLTPNSDELTDFRDRLISLVGIVSTDLR